VLFLEASMAAFRGEKVGLVGDDPLTLADNTQIDLSGNRLTKAPEWTGNLGLQISYPITSLGVSRVRAEWIYKSSMFFDYFNHDFARDGPYRLWNVFLNLERKEARFVVPGFVKNLNDEVYIARQWTPSLLTGGPITYYSLPRTWGVELYARF